MISDDDDPSVFRLDSKIALNEERIKIMREIFATHKEIPPQYWWTFHCPVCYAAPRAPCGRKGREFVRPHVARKNLECGVGTWTCTCGVTKTADMFFHDDHIVIELAKGLKDYPYDILGDFCGEHCACCSGHANCSEFR